MARHPDNRSQDREQPQRRLSPWIIMAIYLVIGALWILLSDRLLAALTDVFLLKGCTADALQVAIILEPNSNNARHTIWTRDQLIRERNNERL